MFHVRLKHRRTVHRGLGGQAPQFFLKFADGPLQFYLKKIFTVRSWAKAYSYCHLLIISANLSLPYNASLVAQLDDQNTQIERMSDYIEVWGVRGQVLRTTITNIQPQEVARYRLQLLRSLRWVRTPRGRGLAA